MKKNVFSRTIAVLASMTVIGVASMLSASAGGVIIGTVEVDPGTTKVKVPVYANDFESTGWALTYTAADPIQSVKPSATLATDGDTASGLNAIYASGEPYELYPDGEPFSELTVQLDPNAEPGTYPITVSISRATAGDGSNLTEEQVAELEGIAGAIVVKAPATEAQPTEPPATAAPTTAAPATTAATTTPKAGSSPKTGSTGVAVAVAGLVTAGATAVVLKKKH